MKTAIQILCSVMVLTLFLSGCRANTAKTTVTETTTPPTTEATTVPTTLPTTEPVTQPTLAETTTPTEENVTVPDVRSGLADENGIISNGEDTLK